MSALINNIGLSNDNPSVTKISANARIDYILRFSKQAILVIDESAQQNAQITHQFIASLPEQHNAAYISLSAQFSDIQLRCRIIEQLSAGELFDPEISLAVSIINLAKKPQQAISLVLDNAQHLSLQILHEVSQLAAIAKKANLIINVVMFGSPQAGVKIQDNKSLFHNKLTLLSAQSGQLLSANATIFKAPQAKWYAIKLNQWLLSIFIFLAVIATIVIVLLKQDDAVIVQKSAVNEDEKITLSTALLEPQTMVLNKAKKAILANANAVDIYLSLTRPEKIKLVEIKQEILPATANDIIIAMTSFSLAPNSLIDNNEMVNSTFEPQNENVSESADLLNLDSSIVLNNNYYLNKDDGFVIQIAVFSDVDLLTKFTAGLTGVEYYIHQRLLNNKTVFVITSAVFTDRALAEHELLAMPESIVARQPWIKPLEAINNEINAFQGSQ